MTKLSAFVFIVYMFLAYLSYVFPNMAAFIQFVQINESLYIPDKIVGYGRYIQEI